MGAISISAVKILFVLVSHALYLDYFHADVNELSQKEKNLGLYFYFHSALLV